MRSQFRLERTPATTFSSTTETRSAECSAKTGRLRAGAVLFNVCSCYGHHSNPAQVRRDYHGEVDYFAVFCNETDGVYLVPIHQISTRVLGTLRVTPPRNNQMKHVRWAADFQIGCLAIGGASGRRRDRAGRAPGRAG